MQTNISNSVLPLWWIITNFKSIITQQVDISKKFIFSLKERGHAMPHATLCQWLFTSLTCLIRNKQHELKFCSDQLQDIASHVSSISNLSKLSAHSFVKYIYKYKLKRC